MMNVRFWHEADQITELEVRCERKAHILSRWFFLYYYLYVAMLYGYIYTEVRISLFLDHN